MTIDTHKLETGNVVATLGLLRAGQTRRARTVRRVVWRTVEGIDLATGLCRVRFFDGTHAVALIDDQWHRAAG